MLFDKHNIHLLADKLVEHGSVQLENSVYRADISRTDDGRYYYIDKVIASGVSYGGILTLDEVKDLIIFNRNYSVEDMR